MARKSMTRRKMSQYGGASVRDWYMAAFPTDDMGADIDPSVTFDDAIRFIERGGGDGFYDFIGVHDSLVRQRIFYEISDETGIDYDYWYTLWLHGDGLRQALSNYTSDYDIKSALGNEWGVQWIRRNIKNASRRMAQVGTNLEWEHEVDDNGDWWFADVDDFELSIWFPESFNGSELDAYQWNIYRRSDGYVSLGGGEPSLEQAMDAAYREIAEYDDTIMEMDGSRRNGVHTAQSWGYNPDAYDFFIVTNGYDEFRFDAFDKALQFYEEQDPEQEWNVEMNTSPTGIAPRDFSWQLEGWNYDGDWDEGEYIDTLEYKSYTKEDWMQTLTSANTAHMSAARNSTRTATRNFTYAEQQSLQDESLGEMARNRHKLKNVDDDEADASAMFM